MRSQKARTRSFSWMVVGVLSLGLAGPALGQLKVEDLSREERKLAQDFAKGRIPQSNESVAALQKAVSREMARLTQPNELANYGMIRSSLQSTYLSIQKSEAAAARKVIIDTIVAYAGGIATRAQFSPQSRINCMALLAELDDVPQMRSDPPQPSAKAFNVLVQVAKDESAPIYLRAPALHGLQRHIGMWWQFNRWNADQKKVIKDLLVAIIDSKPKHAMEADGHIWLVRRAFDCLGAAGLADAAPQAITHLVNAKARPSLRVSAASYLSKIDCSALTEEQKSDYLIGTAHLIREYMYNWYGMEDDLLKRASGASGGGGYGGMGGMMGGGMGGYGGSGGYGGDGGDEGGMGGMGGMMGGMGGYGGSGGYGGEGGGASSKPKPIDTQDWETRLARRRANQVAEVVHICLDGLPMAEEKPANLTGKPLMDAGMAAESQQMVPLLIEKLDALQTAINDPETITTVNSLLSEAELPIEDIMDVASEIPGFAQKYPELADETDLETVPDVPVTPPMEGGDGSPPSEGAPGAGAPDAGAPDAGAPDAGGQGGPAMGEGGEAANTGG